MSRSAVDFESLPQGMLFMNAALVLLLGHFSLTKSDLCAAFRSCFHQRPPPEPCEGPGLDQQQRYEEDLLKKRVEMIALQNKIAVHWALIFVCSSLWMLMQYSDLGSFCVFLGSLLIYVMHAFASQGRINTKAFVECWMFAKFMAHALVTLSVLKETDLVRLVSVEKLCQSGVLFCSVAFLDLRASLPPHVIQSLVFAYKHCEIAGFANVTPMMLYANLGMNL